MALRGLPVDAAKASPLRGGARRGAEQRGQLLQSRRRLAGRRDTEVVVVGLVLAFAKLRAEQCDGRACRLRQIEELARVFHRGQARIVAAVAVERGKPEELVAADVAAHAEAPDDLVVGRRVRHGRKAGVRGRARVLHPLRKGIPRAPGVLAVEEEALAVECVAAALGADGGASAGGA